MRGRALLQLPLLVVLLGSFISVAVDSGAGLFRHCNNKRPAVLGAVHAPLCQQAGIRPRSYTMPRLPMYCHCSNLLPAGIPCTAPISQVVTYIHQPALASCSPSCLTPPSPGCSPCPLLARLLLPTGAAGASYIALTGDLPGALLAFKTHYPILAIPVKAVVAFPIIYHYLGGLRHFAWDLHKIGNNADRTSLLETPRVEQSSQILLGSSIALTLVAALM